VVPDFASISIVYLYLVVNLFGQSVEDKSQGGNGVAWKEIVKELSYGWAWKIAGLKEIIYKCCLELCDKRIEVFW